METNYYFDPASPLKPYTHSLPANPDSLPPPNATRLTPEMAAGFWPCWDGESWVQVEDHRSQKAYDKKTGAEVGIEAVGPLPDTLTGIPWPGPAYRWDGSGWVYDISMDSPGPEYEWRDNEWWKVRFSKKDFLLLCGIPQIAHLNTVRRDNAMAETVYTLLMAADFIDVTDPATAQMVGLLATGAAGNVLTAEDAARILAGRKYVESV